MGGPLDDAFRSVSNNQARLEADLAAKREAATANRRKLQDLVDDFLSRMHAAGDPGTNWDMREGMFRKVRGWKLSYRDGEKWWPLVVRIDGLVPHVTANETRYMRPIDTDLVFSDQMLKTLALDMAEIMQRHRVS